MAPPEVGATAVQLVSLGQPAVTMGELLLRTMPSALEGMNYASAQNKTIPHMQTREGLGGGIPYRYTSAQDIIYKWRDNE